MSSQPAEIGRPREELLRQRSVRTGWVLVGIGLLIPMLALLGAASGWRVRQEHGGQVALIVTGVVVFVVRLGLWIADVRY